MVARLESRKALLGGDPGFATYGGQGAQQYSQNLDQSHDPTYDQTYDQTFDQVYTQDVHHSPPYPEPAYPQATYNEPAFAENHRLPQDYNEGYAHREGLAPSGAESSVHEPKFAFLKSRWPAVFSAVTGLQAIICLAFEGYVFGKFQLSLNGNYNNDAAVQSQYKTIPTFLTLFIFGFLYEIVVVWDALRMKNTIQVIGVCISNLALLVYTAIQVDQIQKALGVLWRANALHAGTTLDDIWAELKPFLVAIPAIIALATIGMAFITWKLYQEFAWDILKNIGADYRMKKRFLYYQIYIALLKFDFFFFLGFIIQFVVIVEKTNDPEFALTIATIPVTIIILFAAAFFTRRENKIGMVCIIVLYLGGLSYFIFKLVRIYQKSHREAYAAVQKSLTAFAVITIILIILTIGNAIVCMNNFKSGLKAHLMSSSKKEEEKPDLNSINLQDVQPQVPSRMTIE